jgi:predicted dehydrogenase
MSKKIDGPVRVALIGAGGISEAHGRGYLRHADKIKCVALCDVSAENIKKRSDQLCGVAARYSDWRVMFKEMAGRLDAVDICLPHHLHAAAILDAAAAGLHILCEKPMCTTLAEADQIAAGVKRAGVTYMSAHNFLFSPAVREAKRMIDAGAIGRVFWLRTQDCFALPLDFMRSAAGSWRVSRKTQGGGELIDTGYHPSYMMIHLAGSPAVAVRGTMGRFVQNNEGEDTASVQIRFANGIIGELLTSWAFPLPSGTHQIHIIGEKGEIFGTHGTLYHLPRGAKEATKHELAGVDMFVEEIGHFADCLREGRRPLHGVEEGRAVLELILQATQSAEGW